MSKYKKSPLARMIKASEKIKHFEERLKQETGKKRHRIHRRIIGLKQSLRFYSNFMYGRWIN